MLSSFELCDRLILTDSASGGTPFCKPYRYVPPQKVWVLRRFGLKMGIKTFSILVWNRADGIEGTTGVYERINRKGFRSAVSSK